MPSSPSTTYFLLSLALPAIYATVKAKAQDHFSSLSYSANVNQGDWASLNASVGGRLLKGVPFAQPCFVQPFNSTACENIRSVYVDESEHLHNHHFIYVTTIMPASRANAPGAYIQTQWETCQRTGEQCLLDYVDVGDVDPTLPPWQCKTGSVPSYFVSNFICGIHTGMTRRIEDRCILSCRCICSIQIL